MFCPTCDEVYSLPQNANIKVCPTTARTILVVLAITASLNIWTHFGALPSTDRHAQQYTGNVCPLDGFDLVRVTMGKKSKAYPVCPHCYNNPPFEDLQTGTPAALHQLFALVTRECAIVIDLRNRSCLQRMPSPHL